MKLKEINLSDLKGHYHSKKDVDVLIEDGIAFIAGNNTHQYVYEFHYNELDKLIDYSIYKDYVLYDGGQIDDMLKPHHKFTVGDLLRIDPFNYSKEGDDFIKFLDYDETIEKLDECNNLLITVKEKFNNEKRNKIIY